MRSKAEIRPVRPWMEALECRRHLSATVSGRVFEDVNQNGTFDTGDRPRAGDVVGIRDGDTFYAAAHTDAQGRYSLTLAGSDSATLYHLRRWKGMVNLRYTTRPVSFNAGQVTTVDLPTEESGSIWGTAITDTSLNGRYDAGETATLGYIYIDQDNDWMSDGIWAASDANGHYEIDDLPPGEYRLRASQGARRMLFPRDSHRLTLAAGESRGNFPFFLSPVGGTQTVDVTVFEDDNANGQHDLSNWSSPFENHYRAGLSVFIDLNGNGRKDALEPAGTTNSQGGWHVTGLSPGTHRIVLHVPEGDSVTTPGGAVQTVHVGFGAHSTAVRFGLTGSKLLRGRIFHDAAGGAEPLVGEQVYLDFNVNGQRDANEPAVGTNADGVFIIGPLQYRNWAVGLVNMPESARFKQTEASQPHDRATTIVRPGNGIVEMPIQHRGALGGLVFMDSNENGVHDPGEPVAANQPVWHDLSAGSNLNGTTILTDANGRYSVPIWPGNEINVGIGVYLGMAPPTTLPAGGAYLGVSILSGEERDDLDFGLRPA